MNNVLCATLFDMALFSLLREFIRWLIGSVSAYIRNNWQRPQFINHGLRGSVSPVLTATGLVNRRWQFSTPTKSTPLDRSSKTSGHIITSTTPTVVTNLLQIRPRRDSKQIGKIYGNFWLIYLYRFFQVRPVDEFSRWAVDSCKVCRLGVWLMLLPILVSSPPKPQIWRC